MWWLVAATAWAAPDALAACGAGDLAACIETERSLSHREARASQTNHLDAAALLQWSRISVGAQRALLEGTYVGRRDTHCPGWSGCGTPPAPPHLTGGDPYPVYSGRHIAEGVKIRLPEGVRPKHAVLLDDDGVVARSGSFAMVEDVPPGAYRALAWTGSPEALVLHEGALHIDAGVDEAVIDVTAEGPVPRCTVPVHPTLVAAGVQVVAAEPYWSERQYVTRAALDGTAEVPCLSDGTHQAQPTPHGGRRLDEMLPPRTGPMTTYPMPAARPADVVTDPLDAIAGLWRDDTGRTRSLAAGLWNGAEVEMVAVPGGIQVDESLLQHEFRFADRDHVLMRKAHVTTPVLLTRARPTAVEALHRRARRIAEDVDRRPPNEAAREHLAAASKASKAEDRAGMVAAVEAALQADPHAARTAMKVLDRHLAIGRAARPNGSWLRGEDVDETPPLQVWLVWFAGDPHARGYLPQVTEWLRDQDVPTVGIHVAMTGGTDPIASADALGIMGPVVSGDKVWLRDLGWQGGAVAVVLREGRVEHVVHPRRLLDPDAEALLAP